MRAKTRLAGIALALLTTLPAYAQRFFPPCPPSPNCVSTTAPDARHTIAPLRFRGPRPEAMRTFERLLRAMPRARIQRVDATTIRAEFRTLVFRFVDDSVFVFDDSTKTVQFRSASRVGYSDLGVNRRRMESIRAAWTRADR